MKTNVNVKRILDVAPNFLMINDFATINRRLDDYVYNGGYCEQLLSCKASYNYRGLVSYSTVVGIQIDGTKVSLGYFSATTSQHLSKWGADIKLHDLEAVWRYVTLQITLDELYMEMYGLKTVRTMAKRLDEFMDLLSNYEWFINELDKMEVWG